MGSFWNCLCFTWISSSPHGMIQREFFSTTVFSTSILSHLLPDDEAEQAYLSNKGWSSVQILSLCHHGGYHDAPLVFLATSSGPALLLASGKLNQTVEFWNPWISSSFKICGQWNYYLPGAEANTQRGVTRSFAYKVWPFLAYIIILARRPF